jgi:hypothetical protein
MRLEHNQVTRDGTTVRRAGANNDESYFALAMACADVDHPHPGDRPWGTLYRFPNQAAGASGADPLPGVARAAPPFPRWRAPTTVTVPMLEE